MSRLRDPRKNPGTMLLCAVAQSLPVVRSYRKIGTASAVLDASVKCHLLWGSNIRSPGSLGYLLLLSSRNGTGSHCYVGELWVAPGKCDRIYSGQAFERHHMVRQ